MIKITCGTCYTSKGMMHAGNGAVSLPATEEARFVRKGVAKYVAEFQPVDEPDENEVQEGLLIADDKSGSEELQDGQKIAHLDKDQLMTMKLDQLKAMAADMGVDCKGLRTKEDYADAICAVEVIIDDETGCVEKGAPFDTSEEDIVI